MVKCMIKIMTRIYDDVNRIKNDFNKYNKKLFTWYLLHDNI